MEEDNVSSYSFPPSVEDLTSVDSTPVLDLLVTSKPDKVIDRDGNKLQTDKDLNNEDKSGLKNIFEATGNKRLLDSSLNSRTLDSETPRVILKDLLRQDPSTKVNNHVTSRNASTTSSSLKSDLSIAGDPSEAQEGLLGIDTSFRKTTSRLSNLQSPIHLPPAFMLKPAPANPHTTVGDVNSIISRESHTNALNSREEGDSSLPPMSPVSGAEFKNSIRIWQQKNLEADAEEARAETDAQSSDSNFMRRTFASMTSPIFSYSKTEETEKGAGSELSPKIIAYRKNTHERRESDLYSELLEGDERFDPRLYVKEKYKTTPYRYATIRRNVEFHQIFRSHDLTDRLLDDFACALSREILLQGRAYVTESSICFNSNLLGWVTSLVVLFSDVTRIEKKSTAGLFPNGILIETSTSKHNFASFLSRDSTYVFIRTIWLHAVGKDLADLDSLSNDESRKKNSEDHQENSQRRISNYIMSIDEDDQNDGDWSEDQMENTDDNNDNHDNDAYSLDGDKEERGLKGHNGGSESSRLPQRDYVVLKKSSQYQNNGPLFNSATTITQLFEDSEEEIEAANVTLDAPLGIVFDIMFGSVNTAFHRKVLDTQGATEVTKYGPFMANEEDLSILERKYSYRRPLGFSIGPKSTKCCVTEVIEHQDYAGHVVVLSITATPDVPSGGFFTVRTRHYFLWAEDNHTNLRVAFFVKWTGNSWIKNMVEKLTLSAQKAVNTEIIEMLKVEIQEQTEKLAAAVSSVQTKSSNPPVKQLPPKPKEESKRQRFVKASSASGAPTASARRWMQDFASLEISLSLLAIIVALGLMQWKLVRISLENRALMEKQIQLTSLLVRTIELDSGSQDCVLKGAGGRHEQVAELVKQALLLLDNKGE